MKLRTLSAGKYRHVGQFYNNSLTTKDATGQVVETPVAVSGPKHFSIEPITGLESFLPEQVNVQGTHLIRLRWFSEEITAASWLIWGSNRYDIKEAFDLDGMKRELVLFAVLHE